LIWILTRGVVVNANARQHSSQEREAQLKGTKMTKWTETKIFRKASAGYDFAKVVIFLFWIPLLALAALYFFM